MVTRRFVLGGIALLLALTGCTSSSEPSGPLPDGQPLLTDAAASAAAINSAHFTIVVNGTVPGLTVQGAEGDLNKDGSGKGTAKISQSGLLLEVEFVLLDKKLYIKGPTGPFQEVPGGTDLYDPSAILDPARGIAKVISSISDPKTETAEKINDTPTYRVSGKSTKAAVQEIVPGVTGDVDIKVWVREDGKHQPVRAWIQLPPEKQGAGAATVEVTLSEVDKPVTVSAPPTA